MVNIFVCPLVFFCWGFSTSPTFFHRKLNCHRSSFSIAIKLHPFKIYKIASSSNITEHSTLILLIETWCGCNKMDVFCDEIENGENSLEQLIDKVINFFFRSTKATINLSHHTKLYVERRIILKIIDLIFWYHNRRVLFSISTINRILWHEPTFWMRINFFLCFAIERMKKNWKIIREILKTTVNATIDAGKNLRKYGRIIPSTAWSKPEPWFFYTNTLPLCAHRTHRCVKGSSKEGGAWRRWRLGYTSLNDNLKCWICACIGLRLLIIRFLSKRNNIQSIHIWVDG